MVAPEKRHRLSPRRHLVSLDVPLDERHDIVDVCRDDLAVWSLSGDVAG